MKKTIFIALALFACAVSIETASAQDWSGVLDNSRAPYYSGTAATSGWMGAGAGTIPARTSVCSSPSLATGAGNAAANGATIRSAIASCASGNTVQLPSGTYYVDYIAWGTSLSAMVSNVTLRGAGANSTFLISTTGINCSGLGAAMVCWRNADNNYNGGVSNLAAWTGGYTKGTTSITLGSFSQGSIGNLHVGSLLILNQLDDASDTGNIYACGSSGFNGACSQQGSSGGYGQTQGAQSQQVTVTSISGSTIGISPGLYDPNWTSGKSPIVWFSSALPVAGDGLENMSLDYSGIPGGGGTGEPVGIQFTNTTNSWVKNVRGINGPGGVHKHVELYQSSHITVRDSYFYGANGTSESYGVDAAFYSSDNLAENNICQHIATCIITENAIGTVSGYNYSVDNFYNGGPDGSGIGYAAPQWQQEDEYHHNAGDHYGLFEGDEGIGRTDDAIHGTTWMNTDLRSYWNGRDQALTSDGGSGQCAPYASPCPKFQQTNAMALMTYSRYENVIGVVVGTVGYHTTYQFAAPNSTDCGNAGASNLSVFTMGYGADEGGGWGPSCNGQSFSIPNDTFVQTSLYRWGIYAACTGDAACGSVRFVTGEVPSGLSVYAQPLPANHNIPLSFYLPAAGASAPPFWQTMAGNPPWPAIGPDVTGGNISGVGGHANLIPAALCALNIMGINPNGSSGVQPYDANTICGYYTGGGGGSPTVVLSLTSGGGAASSYNFGSVVAGGASATQQVWVNNTGTGPLTITPPITGSDTTDFPFIMNQCASSGFTVAAGSQCYMEMQFTPGLMATGSLSSTITITDNATGSPRTFTLNGTVSGSTPPVAPGAPSIISIIAQ